MRTRIIIAGLLLVGAIRAGAAEQNFAARIEMLDWADPAHAAQVLDVLPVLPATRPPDFELLEVRGMVYADLHRDDAVSALLADLKAREERGEGKAPSTAHYIRAYSAFQRVQYDTASSELAEIDLQDLSSATERYRFALLRGNTLRLLGQSEAGLALLEKAFDLANDLHDDTRRLHAMLSLAHIYINTGNLDRASAQLNAAKALASKLGDEAALVEVAGSESDVADRRGDHAAERAHSLAALAHAQRSGSAKWLAHALVNLGDSYLKSHDYAESLRYSRAALPILVNLRESGNIGTAQFNEGLAYIGLGNIKPGEKLAEEAIANALAGNDLLDAKEQLREYADALEHAGYLMMALQAYHRYDELTDKLMTSTRQRAFLELSAKFDDERRARELELLRRDNALAAAEMRGQRLGVQLAVAGVVFIVCICAALLWAFARVRRANNKLRFNSERDALTGLRNRRYFNENVLAVEGARPVGGCVLLADLDHFKRINDTFGHPAGDAVLATVSYRLAAALRETDKLVRWGGEEFLAVLDPISPEQADATVERLLQAVRGDPVLWNGHAITCTISIGYACFPMRGAVAPISLESAISLVDKALYQAKRLGRNRACLIGALNALDAAELSVLSADFDAASPDGRIRLVEIGTAA